MNTIRRVQGLLVEDWLIGTRQGRGVFVLDTGSRPARWSCSPSCRPRGRRRAGRSARWGRQPARGGRACPCGRDEMCRVPPAVVSMPDRRRPARCCGARSCPAGGRFTPSTRARPIVARSWRPPWPSRACGRARTTPRAATASSTRPGAACLATLVEDLAPGRRRALSVIGQHDSPANVDRRQVHRLVHRAGHTELASTDTAGRTRTRRRHPARHHRVVLGPIRPVAPPDRPDPDRRAHRAITRSPSATSIRDGSRGSGP